MDLRFGVHLPETRSFLILYLFNFHLYFSFLCTSYCAHLQRFFFHSATNNHNRSRKYLSVPTFIYFVNWFSFLNEFASANACGVITHISTVVQVYF